MLKLRSVIMGLASSVFILCVFLLAIGEDMTASGVDTVETASANQVLQPAQAMASSETMASPETMASNGVQVGLSALQRTTSYDVRDADRSKFNLPLLYLHREREGTAAGDRTLTINLSGLAGGTEIEVEVVSRHEDISTGGRREESSRFVLPDRPCTSDDPCTVQWTFDPATALSDLYYLRVKDGSGRLLWENLYPDRPDVAVLDTWDMGIDGYTVRVYYATLFPFARGQNDLDNRLSPRAVTDFVAHQFVPIIADTWNTQFHTWGFAPIHPDWDRDGIVEVIITAPPFALFDGTGTYAALIGADSRPYPERRIWWFSSNNTFQAYDSLENGCKVTFSHEFFHLVQWNTLVSTGHPESFWLATFIEAQGKFASSVQYPELEIHQDHWVVEDGAYTSAANRFLTLRLKASYRDLEADGGNKYDLAPYWRFVYEQFGGMGVIRVSLEEMVVHFSPDIVGSMKNGMNRAFERLGGPFHTFEESLIGFARANYALRLQDGRCAAADPGACGGLYYDPDNAYADPPLEAKLYYAGSPLTYDSSIPASFGMDFVELSLNPVVHNQPVVITFRGAGAAAQFNVQIWKLGPGGTKPRAVAQYPEIVPQNQGDAHVYVIPRLDTTTCDRLVMIITRVDADETIDPAGNYHVTLESTSTVQ